MPIVSSLLVCMLYSPRTRITPDTSASTDTQAVAVPKWLLIWNHVLRLRRKVLFSCWNWRWQTKKLLQNAVTHFSEVNTHIRVQNFEVHQLPLTSLVLGANILLRTLFSNIMYLCSCLCVGDQFSHLQHEVSHKRFCKELKLIVSKWLFLNVNPFLIFGKLCAYISQHTDNCSVNTLLYEFKTEGCHYFVSLLP
jgi:hypothetical protein